MGSKITLPSAFTAATGKTLSLDAVMPPSQGAVLLIDGSHSLGGIGAALGTLPAIGDRIKNIAWEQAAAMYGSGTQDDFSPTFDNGTSGGNNATAEKTTKGGLHVAARQDVQAAGHGKRINLSASLQALLLAKKTDNFYISMWNEVTRAAAAPATNPAMVLLCNTSTATANYVGFIRTAASGDLPTVASGKRAGARSSNGDGLGHGLRNIGNIGLTGAVTAFLSTLVLWGSASTYDLSANPTQCASFVLYRLYIEDLTVSGRTYAEVDAIDYALFQAAFAAGGKFNGDSWTAPATLAGG